MNQFVILLFLMQLYLKLKLERWIKLTQHSSVILQISTALAILNMNHIAVLLMLGTDAQNKLVDAGRDS